MISSLRFSKPPFGRVHFYSFVCFRAVVMKVLQRGGVETATKTYHRGALVPSTSCLRSARTWCRQRPCPRGARLRTAFAILSGPARTFPSASPDGGRGAKARRTRTPNLGGETPALPFSRSPCAPRSAGAWRSGAEEASPRPLAAGFLGLADSISWEARGREALPSPGLLRAAVCSTPSRKRWAAPLCWKEKRPWRKTHAARLTPTLRPALKGAGAGSTAGVGRGAGSIFCSARRRAAEF